MDTISAPWSSSKQDLFEAFREWIVSRARRRFAVQSYCMPLILQHLCFGALAGGFVVDIAVGQTLPAITCASHWLKLVRGLLVPR